MATAKNNGVKIVRHWEGDEFDWGGANVRVLFPPSDWQTRDKPQNNDSMVLRVSFADTSVLLEGDAEKTVERRVAAMEHPRANLLKVGHHGSANATRLSLKGWRHRLDYSGTSRCTLELMNRLAAMTTKH